MVSSRKPRGRIASRLLAAGLSLLLTFAAAELVARTLLARHWRTDVLAAKLDRISIKSVITLDDDPALRYRLRPDLDVDFQGSRVITDSAGVRVGATAPADAAGALRIAMVGDSTSFGWRVNYEDTYGEQLRRRLEELSGAPVALRNFSVPGYNASQEFTQFEKEVSRFGPQLLIVHHDHNDSQPVGWGYGGWLPPEYGDNALHSAALKILLRKLKTMRDPEVPESTPDDGETVEGYFANGPHFEAMLESRRALIDAARAAGIPVLIVVFNAHVRAGEADATNQAMARLHTDITQRFQGMGGLVLDLYPVYQRLLAETNKPDMSALWVDAEDRHPNAQGHAFIADTLVHFIESTPELSGIAAKR